MAALDVVVLCSEREGFGRVLVEAMAASRPVVATATGGIPEVVADGQTGSLVPVGDVEALARAIDRLLRDHERAAAMGRAGRRRAEERFGLEAHVQAVQQLYREMLGD
jgi:glycosyltransferase involved in cell wall biosynthesis